jgi:peptide/nickel transport system ATP-binding protein
MIAMALALEPRILIADEPTTALDVTTQAQILKLIEDLRQKHGMAVIFITHDFGVVADIADRVIVMEKGLIVEQGSVDDVLLRSKHPYTQKLVRAIPGIVAGEKHDFAEAPVILKVDGLTKVFTTGGGFFSKPRVVRALDDVSFELHHRRNDRHRGRIRVGEIHLRARAGAPARTRQRHGRNGRGRHGQAEGRGSARKPAQDPDDLSGPVLVAQPAGAGRAHPERRADRLRHPTPRGDGRARELLSLVGLDASAVDRFPHEFSGGQRQRIGIARALALDPDIIIADEAVSALDVSIQAQVLDLLADLKERLNLSMLFITHDLRVAAQVCDRIMVMQHGKVVEIGPANRVLMAPEHPYTRSLLDAVPGKEYEEALKKVVGK